MSSVDVSISGSGTVYLARPISDAAKEWFDENVETPDWVSSYSVPVEHRYIENLTVGLIEAGFDVEVNGKPASVNSNGDVVVAA